MFCIEIYSVFQLSKNKSLYENNPPYVNFVLSFGFYHNYQVINKGTSINSPFK